MITEEELKKLEKEGKVERIEEEKEEIPPLPPERASLEDYLVFLEMLRRMKTHRTTAPTHKPKSFLEQIEFYDDGVNRRIYLYINGTWRYASLT